MAVAKFIHLNLSSSFSLGESTLTISRALELCKKNHMPALALTDHHNMFGIMEFAIYAAKSGIQPIVGARISLEYNREDQKFKQEDTLHKTIDHGSLTLLAKSAIGYKNLMNLISWPYLNQDAHGLNPPLPWPLLQQNCEGLILLTGAQQINHSKGYLPYAIERFGPDFAQQQLKMLRALFDNRIYIELSRTKYTNFETESIAIDYAYALGLPLVATNPVLFSDPTMEEAQNVLLCIANNAYLGADESPTVDPEGYFKSEEQMCQLFADLPEAIENTLLIAQRCEFMPTIRKPILPPYPTPEGVSEEQELRRKSHEGLQQRLSKINHNKDAEEYWQRLDYELNVIIKMGFAGYFLIVSDFIQWAKNNNISVGPGRGSGAGSIVAWALTITDIDPVRFNLIFERFLNPERVSMPDFDIDFCQDRREEVINYVRDKYGSDRVAQIITFGKLQARAVLRDVGRVLQMPYTKVDKISKLVPHNPANPVNLAQAIEIEPELKELIRNEEEVSRLVNIALKLEGLYRHASTHAAGIVIGPLAEVVPLYKDPRAPLPATQFNMKDVEQAGLLKFDFLGLKTLTLIARTVELIKKTRKIDIDISDIPLDDKKSYEVLARAETTGVFQLESSGMREVIRKLKPDQLEEIIAAVALFRPGPMDDIPRYINCKQGSEPITYAHPLLQPILEESFGVMVYQEQVMKIAQVMAGYSLGEADLLRRAMGKKIRSEMATHEEKFIHGAQTQHKVPQDIARQIFEQMSKFAGYGFNKSHSAPYGLIAYQTAYLKANYPAEFMATLMSLDIQNTDKLANYFQELRKMEIRVLPPSINDSELMFSVASVDPPIIRYPLLALKNIGEQPIIAMIEERERNGRFTSVTDFTSRASNWTTSWFNKRQIENIICSGAFDELSSNRKSLYESVNEIMNHALIKKNEVSQPSLFEDGEEMEAIALRETEDWPQLERLEREREVIGFYLTAHPLARYQSLLQQHGFDSIRNLLHALNYEAKSFKLLGVITKFVKKQDKKGRLFAFIQISDPTGLCEISVFSDLFQNIRHLLEEGSIISVSGNAKAEGDFVRFTADTIHDFNYILNHITSHSLSIEITEENAIGKLNSLLKTAAPGLGQITCWLARNQAVKFELPVRVNLSLHLRNKIEEIQGLRLVQ